MQLRLAFAVAAFLENEILIIDEVLAVGDAEFQKKCLGKMEDVSRNQGRTVIFVSHNIAVIQRLCAKSVLLQSGKIKVKGETNDVINIYNAAIENSNEVKLFEDKKTWLSGFNYFSNQGIQNKAFTFQPITFAVSVDSIVPLEASYIGLGINDNTGVRLFTLFSKFTHQMFPINTGRNEISCHIKNLNIKPGDYFIEVYIGNGHEVYDYYDHGLSFKVLPSENLDFAMIPDSSQGSFIMEQEWKSSKI